MQYPYPGYMLHRMWPLKRLRAESLIARRSRRQLAPMLPSLRNMILEIQKLTQPCNNAALKDLGKKQGCCIVYSLLDGRCGVLQLRCTTHVQHAEERWCSSRCVARPHRTAASRVMRHVSCHACRWVSCLPTLQGNLVLGTRTTLHPDERGPMPGTTTPVGPAPTSKASVPPRSARSRH